MSVPLLLYWKDWHNRLAIMKPDARSLANCLNSNTSFISSSLHLQLSDHFYTVTYKVKVKVKVKQSHYRPGQAQRVPGGWGSQISRQSAHESGKVVSPTHRPPLPPPRKYSWYSFLLEVESTPRAIVRPEGFCQWKIPVIPSGIEPVL